MGRDLHVRGSYDRLGPPWTWCGLHTVSLALSLIAGEPRAHGSACYQSRGMARSQTRFSSAVDLPPGLPNLGERGDAKKMHRDQWAKIMCQMSVNRDR